MERGALLEQKIDAPSSIVPGYAFNGGRPLFTRPSPSRLPSHHGNNGAGADAATGGEKRPGFERNGNGSSYGYGAERRETRMSID
jgi:hypothetical protein